MDEIPHLKNHENISQLFINRYKTFEEIFAKLTEEYKKANDFNETKKRFVE